MSWSSNNELKNNVIQYRGILVYNICLISISNSVSDGATNKSVLNIEYNLSWEMTINVLRLQTPINVSPRQVYHVIKIKIAVNNASKYLQITTFSFFIRICANYGFLLPRTFDILVYVASLFYFSSF